MGIEKLNRYINNENLTAYENYTLESITRLLEVSGNPQRNLKIIHIAGTNGKGSIAYMLNTVFRESGYKTGLFTSPHLLRINERIKINDTEISDRDLDEYSDEAVEIIGKIADIEPTFFDIITFIGLTYFSEKKVDIAIIETGLGGRLDSTNVVTPMVSVISDISLDHISTLGDSLDKITYEKAGIIKENIPVVTTNEHEEVVRLLRERSREKNSEIYCFGKEFVAEDITFEKDVIRYDYSMRFPGKAGKTSNISLHTYADFQIKNSAAAITALSLLKGEYENINDESISRGIGKTVVPGRFQTIREDPLIIFDPAHNLQAIEKITVIFQRYFPDKKIIVIISLMKDKSYREILDKINEITPRVIYYRLNDPRGYDPSKSGDEDRFSFITDSPGELMEKIRSLNEKNRLFFFTGSFRLYSLARECADDYKRMTFPEG